MSGGSFDYLCFKMDSASKLLDALHTIREMESYLREIDRHDAADEFARLALDLETHKRRIEVMGKRLYDLAKAVEWERDDDVGIDAIDKAWSELLGGEMTLYILFKVGYVSQTIGVFDDLDKAKSHVNRSQWHEGKPGTYIAPKNDITSYKIETHELNHVSIPD